MRPTQERQIGDALYKSTPVPARKALSIGVRLVRILGPGIAALAGVEDSLPDPERESKVALAGAIDGRPRLAEAAANAAKKLAEMLDEKVVVQLVLDILQCTSRTMDGRKDELGDARTFDLVFAANLGEMFEAIGFALEVNRFFGSGGTSGFLDRLATLASRAGFSFQGSTSKTSSDQS